MKNFLLFHNQMVNLNDINANIHLIKSNQYQLYYKSSWQNSTKNSYFEYEGIGKHAEMLNIII